MKKQNKTRRSIFNVRKKKVLKKKVTEPFPRFVGETHEQHEGCSLVFLEKHGEECAH